MIRIKKKKNPTDSEFLKQIDIQKSIDFLDNGIWQINYDVYFKNKIIGFAVILSNRNFIREMGINKQFRRKGIMSYLYDYIEKDRNIKLTPSENLLKDGQEFWENRLKTRTNPTDKQFLSQIKIKKVSNKEYISYEAFYNNKYIAGVDFDPKTKTIWDVWVGPNYRRKGLATFIYNKIEKDQKIKLKPSDTLFPDGQEFWKARLKTG